MAPRFGVIRGARTAAGADRPGCEGQGKCSKEVQGNMGDRMLRGSRLGAVSYESDRNTELAPRQTRDYVCPQGHRFEVPFAVEAEIPLTWECRLDGTTAKLVDGEEPETKKVKPPRTHWDMLLERRSMEELEEILDERLQEMRARRGER
nr:RNA polymerase-binding protein RbpA [Glycomyces mayteni]